MSAVLGLFLGLGLLMLFAYRGYSVIFFAPVFAGLAAVLSGLSLMPTYTEIFLPSLAAYIKVYMPFFLLGAVFGKIMECSGAAESIARAIVHKLGSQHAILAIVLSCAVLTYGGVSLFVVAFAVYPFGASLFRAADIPKRLLPATIALGSFTFTMDALPGTPQIQNTIPMKFFNTDLYAAPIFGTLGAIIIAVSGVLYIQWRCRRARAQGEGYSISEDNSCFQGSEQNLPSYKIALLPLLSVLVLTLVLQKIVFPHWNIWEWATLPPYKMAQEAIVGSKNNWALMVGLCAGILFALCLNPKRIKSKGGVALAINAGVAGSLLAVANTASEVGFGNVIKSLPGFTDLANALMRLQIGKGPLFSEAVTVNVLSGVTGSASGGMSIALDTFGKDYLEWALRVGLDPQLLHRVASMASGGMDTLPHNGAVITLLAITGLTHRQSYKDIFAITLIKTSVVFLLIGLQAFFPFV